MAIEGAALPQLSPDIVPEAPFYIPATGPATRPRLALKHNDTFMVLDSHGDIGATAGGADGLFHCDTRFLSHLELLLNGMQPLLLGSSLRDDNTLLTVDLTNPDIYFDGHLILPKDTLHVVRTIFLWRDTAYQRLGIQNHGDRPLKDFVLKGRNPDRPLLRRVTPFRDVHPANRRRFVEARLETVQEALEVSRQVLLIDRRHLTVYTRGTIFARPTVGFPQKIDVDVV